MALDDAIEFAGGALRIAWRVFAFVCELFVDVFLAKLGRFVIRMRDRESKPSEDACVFVGAVALALLALIFGVVFMLL